MNQGYDLRFEAPPPQLASLDLAELFRRTRSALGRNLWLILAAGLAFASLAAVLVNLQAPYYVARASLIIDPRVDESMGAVQAPTILLADALVVDSQVEVLRSEQIMQRVAARLDLASAASARLAAEHAAVPDSATLAQDVHRGLARSLDIEREGTTYVVRIAATPPPRPPPPTSRTRSPTSTSRRRSRPRPGRPSRRPPGSPTRCRG